MVLKILYILTAHLDLTLLTPAYNLRITNIRDNEQQWQYSREYLFWMLYYLNRPNIFVLLWLIPVQINNRLRILFTNKVSPVSWNPGIVFGQLQCLRNYANLSRSAILNNTVNKQIIIRHQWYWQNIQRKHVFIKPCISRHVLKLAHSWVDIVMTKFVLVNIRGWHSAAVSRFPRS